MNYETEGREGYRAGLTLDDCPYEYPQSFFLMWMHGWIKEFFGKAD